MGTSKPAPRTQTLIPTSNLEYHTTNRLTTPAVSTFPKSGPPIPESDPRAYYTLAQARIGGIRSGDARRFLVRNRHAEVRRLHRKGKPQAVIAALVGYHQSTVCRILSGVIRTCLTLKESAKETAKQAALVTRQRLAIAKLAMREQAKAVKLNNPVSKTDHFGQVNEARKRHFRYYFWRKRQRELHQPDPERAARPPLTGGP